MKKLLGLFVALLISVGLTGGLVAANSGTLENTGPDSDNTITFDDSSDVELNNNTTVSADVTADQNADSGDAWVKYNTTGGDATTGDADNTSEVEATVDIDNSSSSAAALECACSDGENEGTIDTTGYNSNNHITFSDNHTVDVNNNTTVDFNSNVTQNADSGDASVWGNTTGGDATSGDASNHSSTIFSLTVTN